MPGGAKKLPTIAGPLMGASDASTYHKVARVLHWLMAIGFFLMWLTGVLVTNVEGWPWFVENDRQGVIRDLHKSIGLTLLMLLGVRLSLRGFLPAPALPVAIPQAERRLAYLGHGILYATVVCASVTGFAIADLQSYGNAYFGTGLPQVIPPAERVMGWSSNPWSYVLHAVFAYGLLVLVIGHVLSVQRHVISHGVWLLPRMLGHKWASDERALNRITVGLLACALVIFVLGARAVLTLGPVEEPRDYRTTTPFPSSPAVAP